MWGIKDEYHIVTMHLKYHFTETNEPSHDLSYCSSGPGSHITLAKIVHSERSALDRKHMNQ